MKAFKILVLSFLVLLPLSGWAQNSVERWRRLSPQEQEEVLRNYKRWQTLPPRDKERLREEWDRWQSLPQDRRDNLRRRYDELRRRGPEGPRD